MTADTAHNEQDDRERAEGASLDDSELVQAVADLRRAGTVECLDVAEALERVRGRGPCIMPWFRDDVRHALSNVRKPKRGRT